MNKSFGFLFICTVGFSVAAPFRGNPDGPLGLAWGAAGSTINDGNPGKYWVPIEVQSSETSGSVTNLVVVFQESWCSIAEGNGLDDVCESMCPVYDGGAKATYRITATEINGENSFQATRID